MHEALGSVSIIAKGKMVECYSDAVYRAVQCMGWGECCQEWTYGDWLVARLIQYNSDYDSNNEGWEHWLKDNCQFVCSLGSWKDCGIIYWNEERK